MSVLAGALLCVVAIVVGGASSASALSAAELAQGAAHLDALLDLALYADMETARDGMDRMPLDKRMSETARTEDSVTYSRTESSDHSMRSITFNTRSHSHTDTALLATGSSVRGSSCGKDMCKAAGPWSSKCEESVCFPLCLGTVFDVEVTPEGGDNEAFNAAVSSGEASAAVQGLFLGIGCSEFAGCCEKGPKLAQWTESKLGGPQVTALPLEFCKSTEDREAACAACKVKVSVKPKGAETCEAHFQPAAIADAAAAFTRTKTKAPETQHKSFKEKCLAVNDAVTAAQGAMEAAFNGYVCGCLGCCDDQVCPYKVSYSTVAEAMAGANDDGKASEGAPAGAGEGEAAGGEGEGEAAAEGGEDGAAAEGGEESAAAEGGAEGGAEAEAADGAEVDAGADESAAAE